MLLGEIMCAHCEKYITRYCTMNKIWARLQLLKKWSVTAVTIVIYNCNVYMCRTRIRSVYTVKVFSVYFLCPSLNDLFCQSFLHLVKGWLRGPGKEDTKVAYMRCIRQQKTELTSHKEHYFTHIVPNLYFIIIIIIIIIIVSFMQGSHTHIPETNHVPRGYIVAAILS